MPKISVIIPVYNVQKDIGNCLDSILAQSYRNFEVLCIDDGSTDHSSQVIQKYAKKDKRIQYFYHERDAEFLSNAFFSVSYEIIL